MPMALFDAFKERLLLVESGCRVLCCPRGWKDPGVSSHEAWRTSTPRKRHREDDIKAFGRLGLTFEVT